MVGVGRIINRLNKNFNKCNNYSIRFDHVIVVINNMIYPKEWLCYVNVMFQTIFVVHFTD